MKRASAVGLSTAILFTLGVTASASALPTKQSNAGDSISQGFDANDLPSDQRQESWIQGTDSAVHSVYSRYVEIVPGFTQEPESVTGAEMIGGSNNFAAQASRICGQATLPQHVSVLLGGNDVCNRPKSSSGDAAANLYSVETWTNGLRAGLDQLAACLPQGSTVQILSMPRVDNLYTAGHAKSFWCSATWSLFGICRVVTGEGNASRRAQIGARVDQYNDALAGEVQSYNTNSNGQNARGIRFVTDWQGSIAEGATNTSVGTHLFSKDEINIVDCFHPNKSGQRELACLAWATNPDGGSGSIPACFH